MWHFMRTSEINEDDYFSVWQLYVAFHAYKRNQPQHTGALSLQYQYIVSLHIADPIALPQNGKVIPLFC